MLWWYLSLIRHVFFQNGYGHALSPDTLPTLTIQTNFQGSYTPFGAINKIGMVEPSLQVITSKQRPRKLSIRGNNGRVSIRD